MKQALDIYDEMPREQKNYLANYGWHFSERACKYAVERMETINKKTNNIEPVEPWSKDDVDGLLAREGVKISKNTLYDYVFVANMAKADYLGSSIEDDAHIAMFIKDYVDDVDAGDGFIMRRWYATMVAAGEPVNWAVIL